MVKLMVSQTFDVRMAWVALGVVSATFLGSNLYMIAFVYSQPDYRYVSIRYSINEYFGTMVYVFGFGLFISVFASLIIGGPLYIFAHKLGFVNCLTLVFGGALIPTICMGLCEITGWNIPPLTDVHGIVLLFCLAFCGAVGGNISCYGWGKSPI